MRIGIKVMGNGHRLTDAKRKPGAGFGQVAREAWLPPLGQAVNNVRDRGWGHDFGSLIVPPLAVFAQGVDCGVWKFQRNTSSSAPEAGVQKWASFENRLLEFPRLLANNPYDFVGVEKPEILPPPSGIYTVKSL